MKSTIMQYWGITDSRFANAVCKDIEDMMDYSGMELWEVVQNIEAIAEAEQRGIFDAWYANGDNTDNTSRMIGVILSGIHVDVDNETVDDALVRAGVLNEEY